MTSSMRTRSPFGRRGVYWLSLLVVGLACFPGSARAQLDPEMDQPYQLQVVLSVAENRFLTPIFQEQLQRALGDQLRLTLGLLARVEVVRTHPLLAEIDAKGLDTGLDGWDELSRHKTHFVLVDFVAGAYVLRARQYDGMTGLPSPAVRQAQISDRALVAQTAARLVEQDFGLVGTVAEGGAVLQLKGGKLGTNLERWVKPGDVFLVSRITKEGERLRATRVPWTALEVKDVGLAGTCRYRLWHRFQEDDLRAGGGVLGYRCLKIATSAGPLKLRFIDEDSFGPLDGLQVHVLQPGGTKLAELLSNRDGLVISRESFPHLVIVQVLSGGTKRAQFPVELTGDRTVVCRLKVQAGAEAQAPVEFRKEQWLRRIVDNLRLASDRVADLNRELSASLEGALGSARAGLASMAGEIDYLALEREQIRRQAEEKMAKIDLREGENALGALRKKKEELERFAARVDGVLKESKSEATLGLAKLLERARLLEGEADFDQAIALYEKVLQNRPDQAKVKEHLDRLRADWKPINERHAQARKFLIAVWPRLEVADLKNNLAKAREELAVCGKAKDRMTPLKVIQANVVHAANLQKHLGTLKRQDTEDNRTQARVIAQVVNGLRDLHAEAKAIIGKTK